MRLDDFDYPLPPELIAQQPLPARDGSRLLVVPPSGPFGHHRFAELGELLPADALVIVNDARVLPARLRARRPSGGQVEVLLVERVEASREGARLRERWRCLVRAKRSIRAGEALELVARRPGARPPETTFLGRAADGTAEVAFVSEDGLLAVVDDFGEMPLPPYIRREAGGLDEDRERYQTIFARIPGAVAAPTAGLHFTAGTLAALTARGATVVPVTLHVGPGTFAPIRHDDNGDIDGHVMHSERYEVPAATAAAYREARAAGRPVVAVGTTVVRTLESAVLPDGSLRPGPGETRLFIKPGHRFRTASHLVTNFHMPRSTLLLLVCAFAGRERILAAYRDAVAHGYRFFSYGDATWLAGPPSE